MKLGRPWGAPRPYAPGGAVRALGPLRGVGGLSHSGAGLATSTRKGAGRGSSRAHGVEGEEVASRGKGRARRPETAPACPEGARPGRRRVRGRPPRPPPLGPLGGSRPCPLGVAPPHPAPWAHAPRPCYPRPEGLGPYPLGLLPPSWGLGQGVGAYQWAPMGTAGAPLNERKSRRTIDLRRREKVSSS